MNVFRHRHEVENGRTSSISRQILGFDSQVRRSLCPPCDSNASLTLPNSQGQITNGGEAGVQKRGWAEIVEASTKIITFLDLAGSRAPPLIQALLTFFPRVSGHEMYLKTTLSGLIGQMPDYALVGTQCMRIMPAARRFSDCARAWLQWLLPTRASLA